MRKVHRFFNARYVISLRYPASGRVAGLVNVRNICSIETTRCGSVKSEVALPEKETSGPPVRDGSLQNGFGCRIPRLVEAAQWVYRSAVFTPVISLNSMSSFDVTRPCQVFTWFRLAAGNLWECKSAKAGAFIFRKDNNDSVGLPVTCQ